MTPKAAVPARAPRARAPGLAGTHPAAMSARAGIVRLAFDAIGGALLAAALPVWAASAAEDGGKGFWLAFGKPARLCPGARDPVPAKMVGDAWGILASGVLLCKDEGQAYALSVEYLNVRMDPWDRAPLKRDSADFDWLGLALFRPDGRGGTDWLFDAARPVKGVLRREAAGRIVFGQITFRIPKAHADQATNMLFYLTFGKPVVAIRVL